MKTFFKTFLVTTLIFTCLFVPAFAWWDEIQDISIFESPVTLSEELPVMVDENSPFFQSFTTSDRVNVLLLGVNPPLADTIMLVSYNKENGVIDLISIPRDTYYPREGHEGAASKKINASYRDGEALGTAKAVSDLLKGIPINFYMKIDYEGVANIVDSMGGVPMNVPFHMKYTDPYDKPPLYIDIPEGYQTLDGETAMKFIRFRKGDHGYPGYPEGDIGRVATQQEFMKSAFKQALGLNIISVVNSVVENVESDINVKTVVALAKSAKNLSSENLNTYVIPGESVDKGLSYYMPDEEGIEAMLTQIYNPSQAAESTEPAEPTEPAAE